MTMLERVAKASTRYYVSWKSFGVYAICDSENKWDDPPVSILHKKERDAFDQCRLMNARAAVEAMREPTEDMVGALQLFGVWTENAALCCEALVRAILNETPETQKATPEEFSEFKPCRLDGKDSGITEWTFEDVASVTRPAFPGVYYFIDEKLAMDDGRLVGIAFWGPPPAPNARKSPPSR